MNFLKNIIDIKEHYLNSIVFGIISVLFILYLWTILTYTSFMPVSDDYIAVLGFLNNYVQAGSIHEKLGMLFLQHNEHRIVFNRVIEVLQLNLFGEVNFLCLTLIGNLGWILTLFLLWHYAAKRKITSVFSFLPVVLILLTFSHSALITWAMASLQNYWQVLFSLLALFFMTENKPYRTIIFIFFSLFTGGGGIVLIPLTFLYYVIQRNWKQAIVLLFFSIVMLLLYFVFLDYQSHSINRDVYGIIIKNYERFISYFLCFIGNLGGTQQLAIILGVILVTLFIFKSRAIFKKEPFLAWSILFIFAIAFLAAFVRSATGVQQAMSSRYGIYSVLLVSLIYLQYLSLYPKSKKVIGIGMLVGLITFSFYFASRQSAFEERKVQAETKLEFPSSSQAEDILNTSKHLNVFKSWGDVKLPSTLLNVKKLDGSAGYKVTINKQITLSDKNSSKHAEYKIDILPSTIGIKLKGLVYDTLNKDTSCAVITVLDNHKQLFYLEQLTNTQKNIFNSKSPFDNLEATVCVDRLSSGDHTLELRVLNADCSGYYKAFNVIIHKSTVAKMLDVPVVKKKLRGWIDKFEVHQDKIIIKGWYAKIDAPVQSKTLVLGIDGKKYVARYGYNRTVVAKILKNKAYARSGFELVLDKNKISAGKHIVKVYILSDDRSVLFEDTRTYTYRTQ